MSVILITAFYYQIVDNRATCYWLPEHHESGSRDRAALIQFHNNFAASMLRTDTKTTLNCLPSHKSVRFKATSPPADTPPSSTSGLIATLPSSLRPEARLRLRPHGRNIT